MNQSVTSRSERLPPLRRLPKRRNRRAATTSLSGSFDYAKRLRNSEQVQNANRNLDVTPIQVGAPTIRWSGDHLALGRPLPGGGVAQTIIDWTPWRMNLLHEIADLLPAAQLHPVTARDVDRLASIPAALEPGPLTAPLAPATAWMLAGAWIAGLGGLIAVRQR